ncbi:heparinase II/III family protein [Tremella mesenterica]|uniref:Heparinase II/III family protein n=1 Tax=Tremella mesenterica TaxID=5217 RepID=A0A4Q1BWC9_TREME|nr:uncharacterized protein TREMEDRAFT_36930 [Tremella mesenterica DSM 1558]EIW72775.1 hypothetical protein TREMEDRAFT_36930 [Tremella mesenterica DSM 1558]RXK42474.1 heparinase II/III family protein [Tremella mesenterica]
MSHYQPAYSNSPGPGEGYRDDYDGGGNTYGGYQDDPGYGNGRNGGLASESYPMGPRNPNAATSPTGGYVPKKKRNKWLWVVLPIVIILIVIGAVLGGVLGSRAGNKNNSSSSSSSDNSGSGNGNAIPSGVTTNPTATSTGANGQKYLAVATNSQWMLPVYATGTDTAGYSAPTFLASSDSKESWPTDPSPPSNSSLRDHPRLIAPAYRWQALPSLIAQDPYLKYWNDTIIANASSSLNDPPQNYTLDGGLTGSGLLDPARQVKLRIKNWSYAYRMTNDTKYADRVMLELQTAAGNNSDVPWGTDNSRWNPNHFLDLAELCNAFAIGYDWLYDHWTDDQRDAIMWSILNLGLTYGYAALTLDASASGYSWWTGTPNKVNGNWNCVSNGGLTLASLAILDRDPTQLAQKVLALTVPNAFSNCFEGPHSDGTWAETANYWYFGTTGAAEMSSALTTAYGDDRGLAASNPGFALTSLFHMYIQGPTSLFNYGDCGPNKYSTTANSLMYWGSVFNEPRYMLYQRDHYDSSEPWSMFWYDPSVSGTWWDQLAIDHHFDDPAGEWATARTDWTNLDGAYWAMKSGALTGHQTHGDLDLGDFVLDALGERWAGELGSFQYLSDGYFSKEDQDSERWLYYRKRTDGQNTIIINYQNQNVGAQPTTHWDSTGTLQGLAPTLEVDVSDTAYFWQDLTSAVNVTWSRGIRFLNQRKQVLLQDDFENIGAGTDVMWRMHTNATVVASGNTANLTLNGKSLQMILLSGPEGATFTTMAAVRLSQDPPAPTGSPYDIENQGWVSDDGVTVVAIDSQAGGTFSIQVLFNPQWDGMDSSAFVTPKSVALTDWSLTSHS